MKKILVLFILVLLIGCSQEQVSEPKQEVIVIDDRAGIPMETFEAGEPFSEEANQDRFEQWKQQKESNDEYRWRTRDLQNRYGNKLVR